MVQIIIVGTLCSQEFPLQVCFVCFFTVIIGDQFDIIVEMLRKDFIALYNRKENVLNFWKGKAALVHSFINAKT